jgi:hypothetical protein
VRKLGLVATVITCMACLAACGGSARSAAAGGDPGLNFAKCMRANGVTNFPDPTGNGIQIPNGVNPASPSFQAAQKACAKDLPGGPFRGQASAQQKQQMLRMSECMRAHGLANFPDPTSKPPSPNDGFGLAFGMPGSVIAIPRSMINSPEFNRAAAACGIPGARHLPPGKTSPAP